LLLELWQNYSFLFQDIKYLEKFMQNISVLDRPVSGRLLKDFEEIKVLLREVKEFILLKAFQNDAFVGKRLLV